jgi:hypothetical protein
MEIDLITKQDLEAFKIELLNEIQEIIKPESKKKWLTSKDVRELLSISASSLQNLRISGEIQGMKIGGKWYYNYSDLEQLFSRTP